MFAVNDENVRSDSADSSECIDTSKPRLGANPNIFMNSIYERMTLNVMQIQ